MRNVGIVTCLVLAQCQFGGGGGSNGDPGDPEVRLGVAELVVEQSAGLRGRVTKDADYWLSNPYYNWSIRGDQLKSTLLSNRNLANSSIADKIPQRLLAASRRWSTMTTVIRRL